jgi:hypothetical protein
MDVLDLLIQYLSNLGLRRVAKILINFRHHFFPPPTDPHLVDPTPIIVDVHEDEDWEPIEMIRKDCEIPRPSSAATYIMV